jgi:hypothetical protein
VGILVPHVTTAELVHRAQKKKQTDVTVAPPATVRRSFAPPLVVGDAADTAEREADRIADQVIARLRGSDDAVPVAGPAGPHELHRSADAGGEQAVVGAAGGALSDEVSARIERARGGGSPLGGATRSRMESAIGGNLGSVRIHHDEESARLNRMVSARAFTLGNDIFFGRGEYRPDTPSGERVLAHELAHTRQRSGVRRISRLWDLKSKKKLPLGQASKVRTLKSRPIWFVSDRSQDEIVIKPDDQPAGLSDLVAGMQRKIAKVKAVQQRKLDKSEINSLDNMINVYGYPGNEHSWHVRGEYLSDNPQDQAQTAPQTADQEEPATIAVDDALARIKKKSNNIVAMTVAEGEDALSASAPDGSADQGSSGVSRMRQMLDDSRHVHKLGQLNMVDLFVGNMDRMMSGNLGNWFYNPQGGITLIDHVDPGDNGSAEMTGGMVDNDVWRLGPGLLYLNSANRMKAAAREARYKMMQTMERDTDDGGAGDNSVRAWFNTVVDGKKRADRIDDELLAGMNETRAKIIKIFTARKFNLLKPGSWGRGARKTRSKLKKIANKASQVDTGDARYDDDAQLDYFSILQWRARFLVDPNLTTAD